MTKSRSRALLRGMLTVAAMAATSADVLAAAGGTSACGQLNNAYGPYDYRVDRGGTLAIVETYHFTPEVEALIRGITSSLGGELDYTLRAFPNHHRALLALAKLEKRTKTQPVGLHYPVECYFDRALRFRPDDTTARMLYASYLYDNARPAEAEAQLQSVDVLAGDNAFTHYNVGLIYVERRNFDRAVEQARKAYSLGMPRTELRDQLKAAGKWSDAEPKAQDLAASQATAAPPASSASQ